MEHMSELTQRKWRIAKYKATHPWTKAIEIDEPGHPVVVCDTTAKFAHLIVAAPEMYEFLTVIATSNHPWKVIASKLVAKAEGR